MPNGRKRFFIHCQYAGERIWKIFGGTETMTAGEGLPADPEKTLFERIAEIVFRRYERVWKAGTLAVNRIYLQNQLLPYFAGRQIAGIDRQDVRNWFASLGATPAAANRSMPLLSTIMREAERMGLPPRESNPCRGIRRNPRRGSERFLPDDEIPRPSTELTALTRGGRRKPRRKTAKTPRMTDLWPKAMQPPGRPAPTMPDTTPHSAGNLAHWGEPRPAQAAGGGCGERPCAHQRSLRRDRHNWRGQLSRDFATFGFFEKNPCCCPQFDYPPPPALTSILREKPPMHAQPQLAVPYLARFAVPRTPTNPISGAYSEDTAMWMIDTTQGPSPAIECSENCHELSTKTRVQEEADDELALALSTKTAVAQEQDD